VDDQVVYEVERAEGAAAAGSATRDVNLCFLSSILLLPLKLQHFCQDLKPDEMFQNVLTWWRHFVHRGCKTQFMDIRTSNVRVTLEH
jgi:hypothetical protein